MYSDGSALRQLSRDECLILMASVPVGRIIYTRRALPAVELVNFALDHGDIVIRTDRSGKLAAAARGAVVAFEADHLDIFNRAGWSVTAIGQAREVTDPGEIGRLREIHLSSWAPGEREHFIRISPQIVNGRYLRAADEHPATGPPAGGQGAERPPASAFG
jgi:nitroimidazol reductase NimA-like FMN-containing flavoprotein (pyridoxamine 5'-phosphate oxidase superfamily)